MANTSTPAKTTFTYEEATKLLPEVRRRTEAAWKRVEDVRHAVASGAEGPDEAQRQLDAIVQDWAASIREMGIEVKGLWLVDFDNGSGYYCWRYPEPSLQYFHSYEAGFGGRTRIH